MPYIMFITCDVTLRDSRPIYNVSKRRLHVIIEMNLAVIYSECIVPARGGHAYCLAGVRLIRPGL